MSETMSEALPCTPLAGTRSTARSSWSIGQMLQNGRRELRRECRSQRNIAHNRVAAGL
jgi:hypothetical protein